ncbi:MAG TPA: hypothetical protein PKW33_22030 [Anaerolineaceae bacterium]|nr:hypothetical protein [Anaerolineaceae bacterium]HPN54288.1 hypothetical protein [Anaerolineaceae bacterium]
MPRPRRPQVVIVPLKLWLLPGRDDDIIRFMQSIPDRQRAAAVMRAMRGGLSNQAQPASAQEETDSILDQLGELWT